MKSLLDGLNDMQREAVATTDGPLLVIAGAGSGKTRVLTNRIAYILQENLARAEEILAVTFTNKAAGEMNQRISELLNSTSSNFHSVPWCGTFHSICVRILRREVTAFGYKSSFSIYDSTDSLDVVKEAMDRLNINKKEFNPYAVRSAISSAKNELVTSSSYVEYASGYFQENVAKIYPIYAKILRENNALDFDDLILVTTQLFDSYPEVLKRYKSQFKYVHVDEYQDTNHAQYYLIKQLVEKNVCVVGDDDQSIYGFRGADIKNILNFEKDYPEAKIVKLEQNYRSTQTILDAAHSIVHKNENRRPKKLWTESGVGDKVNVYEADDESDESEWVVEKCNSLIEDSVSPNDIAILYRTNAQSRTIEEAFIRIGLPYKIVGSIRFYDRKEVKDLLAYLRIIANPDDTNSLKRVINIPRRGIGDKTFEQLVITARSLEQTPVQFLVNETNSIANTKLRSFGLLIRDLFTGLKKNQLPEFIKFVLDKSGYLEYLDDGTSENQARIENLQEILSVANKYNELESDVALSQFLEDITLIEEQSGRDTEKEEVVTLMTVHASKGLEYKHIFIVGMEEMIFPHSRAYSNPKELEEERRLAYVAVTRAKNNVYITHAKSRVYFGRLQSNPVSRFVEDIPDKLIQSNYSSKLKNNSFFDEYEKEYIEDEYVGPVLEKGDRVRHEIFGRGVVTDINESTVSIDFGVGKGEKELALEFARLEKV